MDLWGEIQAGICLPEPSTKAQGKEVTGASSAKLGDRSQHSHMDFPLLENTSQHIHLSSILAALPFPAILFLVGFFGKNQSWDSLRLVFLVLLPPWIPLFPGFWDSTWPQASSDVCY